MAEHHNNISVSPQILEKRCGIGHFENHGDLTPESTCSATDKETLSECTELVSTTFLPESQTLGYCLLKGTCHSFLLKRSKDWSKVLIHGWKLQRIIICFDLNAHKL